MPNKGIPHSNSALKMYIKILRDCSNGDLPVPNPNERINETNILYALKKEHLIDFDPVDILHKSSRGCVITPKGAMTLIEWDNFLKENSLINKLFNGFSKFLWILLGALVASITDLIELIKCI